MLDGNVTSSLCKRELNTRKETGFFFCNQNIVEIKCCHGKQQVLRRRHEQTGAAFEQSSG